MEDWDASERISVHAVPIGVGGEAEGAVGGLAAAATTEKTASVAGDLVAGDRNVLEDALLHSVVIGVEGSDGELRQHVFLGVGEGEDFISSIVGNRTDFRLL